MVENYFEFHKLLEKEEEHTQANMVCNEESSIDSLTKKKSLTGFFSAHTQYNDCILDILQYTYFQILLRGNR